MSNYVIGRAGAVKIGAVGAAEAACTDLGSVRKITFSHKRGKYQATSAEANDVVVEEAYGPSEITCEMELEEITGYNLALALGGLDTDGSGNVYIDETDSTPSYYTLYVHGFKINGSDKYLHCVKVSIDTDFAQELGNTGTQSTLTVPVTVMYYADATTTYKTYSFLADTTDTTAPTVSTITNGSGTTLVNASGISASVSTTIVWTFSEAIRSEQVTDHNFFVVTSSGATKAGTLSINASCTAVTYTPTGSYSACGTTYNAVAQKGIQDTAGNELAAASVTKFITA